VHLTTEDRDTDDHLLQSQSLRGLQCAVSQVWAFGMVFPSAFEQTGKLPLLRPDQRPDFKTWAQGPNN